MATKKKKRNVGKPMKFNSPEELEVKIEEYFNWAIEKDRHITVSGLAWFLDIDRCTLLRYEDMVNNDDAYKSIDNSIKEKYCNTIKRAKRRIEAECEEGLYNKNSVTGTIFALKNNYGYVDKQEIENSGSTTQKVELSGLSTEEIKKLLEEEKEQ